jgi:hypothetical protein
MPSLRPSPAAHQRQPGASGPLRAVFPCGLPPGACTCTLLPPPSAPRRSSTSGLPRSTQARPADARSLSHRGRGRSLLAGGYAARPSSGAPLSPPLQPSPCSPRSGLVLGADGLKTRWGFGVSGGPACSPGRGPVGFYPAAVAAPSLLQLCRPLSGPPSPGPGSRAAAPGRIRHSWPGPRHPFPAASASICSNHSAAAGVALAPA